MSNGNTKGSESDFPTPQPQRLNQRLNQRPNYHLNIRQTRKPQALTTVNPKTVRDQAGRNQFPQSPFLAYHRFFYRPSFLKTPVV